MKDHVKRVSLVAAGAVLFNIIFWNEKLGINAVLFDALIIPALLYLYPGAIKKLPVQFLLAGHIICLAAVVWQNTVLSQIAFFFTLFLLTAFIQYAHRNAWYAIGSVFFNFLYFPSVIIRDLNAVFKNRKHTRTTNWRRLFRFAVLPAILLVIFTVIYAIANPVFNDMLINISKKFEHLINHFFELFSPLRILFFLLGFYLTGAILEKTNKHYFIDRDLSYEDMLRRKRKKHDKESMAYAYRSDVMGIFGIGNMALKNENTIGIISLCLLNVLLFIVNCVDIDIIWLHYQFNESKPLYKLVHEGTELLITSIFCAMAILLFFFKGNLNFYKKNKWLKYAAYAWIFQNTILVISVLLRDYYYINHYGLAYKRLGVLVFLFMVLVGLVTMFLKIYERKTTYFLFRVNAWAGISLLVVSSCIHWDEVIARYNINHQSTVALDYTFLFSLSDKTLPLIYENKVALLANKNAFNGNLHDCRDKLDNRVAFFMNAHSYYSWLSWNGSDQYVYDYFKDKITAPVAR